MNIVVSKSAPVVVRPSEPGTLTADKILLSPLDKPVATIPVTVLLAFDHPINDATADTIKMALAQALVHYYPIAGRLSCKDDDDGGDFYIDCTGEELGVTFVAASANCTMEEIMGVVDDQPPDDETASPTTFITVCCGCSSSSCHRVRGGRRRALAMPNPAVLLFAVNARKYLGAKDGYYGCCTAMHMAVSKTGTVANGDIMELVGIIRRAKEQIPEQLKADDGDMMLRTMVGEKQVNGYESLLYLTSWRNIGFEDVDFGSGKTARVMTYPPRMLSMMPRIAPICFMLKATEEGRRCATKMQHLQLQSFVRAFSIRHLSADRVFSITIRGSLTTKRASPNVPRMTALSSHSKTR
uniref:Uncharacterized protein n=1 Tax=Oryza nivara TaxID=4536 RepID=A0A0E0FMV2_ORYNI